MAQSIRDDDGVSNPSSHGSFVEIIESINPRRRLMLKTGVSMAAIPFLSSLAACGSDSDATTTPTSEKMLGFTAVSVSTADTIVVPAGYVASTILPWGTPIRAGAPAWKADASNTAAEQEQQVGDNHDGMTYFGFNTAANGYGDRSDEGLLVMNHEYINPEYFYAPDTDAANWLLPFTLEKARKGQAGHGVSVNHVRRAADGTISHVADSRFNRRVTTNTTMRISGPAAGNDLLKTAADATGTSSLGTLNNCANGFTPWGTYLTCEENFNGYFGWNGTRTPTALESRYGISQTGFGYLWHTVDPRFDVNATPNEPNRFGWIVEIDPFDPSATPIKRTALGRFKHENVEIVVAANGKVIAYSGDDERNEYVYKFVSSGTFDRANPTAAGNRNLLDSGTLYVAKFEAGATAGDKAGVGTWIPLVFGQNGLTTENGFTSQADVLVRTRQAADRVGATMMDRPEWISANPKKAGEVYITLTNNNRRGTTTASSNKPDGTSAAGSSRPPIDEANPRDNNVWGHIVRWNETGGDASATTFAWDVFLLAGQPTVTGVRAPSSSITAENIFNSPDGLAFDSSGRLWIQSDGSFSNTGDFAGMGNNQMLACDPTTKEVRRFLVGPSGCEITGVSLTPDRKTMFVNVQHPGEIGSHPRAPKKTDGTTTFADNDIARNATAFSQWPIAGQRPRSATVVVRRSDGGVIGA